jgi:hypothetical protein
MFNRISHQCKFFLKMSLLLLILILSKGQKEFDKPTNLNLVEENISSQKAPKSDSKSFFKGFSNRFNNFLK